jgi:hypothetical protein
MNVLRLVMIAGMCSTVLAVAGTQGRREEGLVERARLVKLFAQGNYKDAYEGYRALALGANTEPKLVGADLIKALECLVTLGREEQTDALREAAVALHKANWRLLQAAAESYLDDQHHAGHGWRTSVHQTAGSETRAEPSGHGATDEFPKLPRPRPGCGKVRGPCHNQFRAQDSGKLSAARSLRPFEQSGCDPG